MMERIARMVRGARGGSRGLTLTELVVTTAIIAVMATVAVPVVSTMVKKQKEVELRKSLRLIRRAIDDYRRVVGENPQVNAFAKTGTDGYPPELDELVKGHDTGELKQRKIKFLRRIPKDPMTGKDDWIILSNQQEKDADMWDRVNVFDVRSRSRATALDGTKYADW
jgi:general secretion pathway protein G